MLCPHTSIGCDDSQQDGMHAVCCLYTLLTLIKEWFPHVTTASRYTDNGPHYACTFHVLAAQQMDSWTGIRITEQVRCEPGEGACIVDAKNAEVKGFMLRNVSHGLGDVLCALSYLENITSGTGLKGLVGVYLDAEDVQTMREHWTAPKALTGIIDIL